MAEPVLCTECSAKAFALRRLGANTDYRLYRSVVFGTRIGDNLYDLDVLRVELHKFIFVLYDTPFDIDKWRALAKHLETAS